MFGGSFFGGSFFGGNLPFSINTSNNNIPFINGIPKIVLKPTKTVILNNPSVLMDSNVITMDTPSIFMDDYVNYTVTGNKMLIKTNTLMMKFKR